MHFITIRVNFSKFKQLNLKSGYEKSLFLWLVEKLCLRDNSSDTTTRYRANRITMKQLD